MLIPSHSTRRPRGTIIVADDSGRETHRDTLQCAHCGLHWIHEPGSGRVRGFCMRCMGPTCGAQACDACDPVEKKLDRAERGGPFLLP